MTLDQTARICRHVEPDTRDNLGGALSPATFTAGQMTYASNGRYAARWLDTQTPPTVPLSNKQAQLVAAEFWNVFDAGDDAGDWIPLADAITQYATPADWTPQRIVAQVFGLWFDLDFLARLALMAAVIRLHAAGPVLCRPPVEHTAPVSDDAVNQGLLLLRFGGSFQAGLMPCEPDTLEDAWPADADQPPAKPDPEPPADQDAVAPVAP